MKSLSVEEQVDKLLEHGVDNPQKWMTVKAYEEPTWGTNNSNGWAKEYRKLHDHHRAETEALFEIIRELAKRLKPSTPAPSEPEDDYGGGYYEEPPYGCGGY